MSGGSRRSSPFAIFGLAAAGLVGAVVALAIRGGLPPLIGYLAGINVAAVALYGYDKAAASRDRLRVPENVLHAVAMAGGSPAAWLSQQLFRHKTVKASFRVSFWLIVAVQLAALGALLWWRQHPPSWLPDAWRSSLSGR
ncbi:MAG: DUF1294 domain-containing protein [Planctomycetaceae bacterium]|nr:DUF1294 domain-containing protein [Planctomycetaceae bacterium]